MVGIRGIADRFDMEELRGMAAVIKQAERIGASIAVFRFVTIRPSKPGAFGPSRDGIEIGIRESPKSSENPTY